MENGGDKLGKVFGSMPMGSDTGTDGGRTTAAGGRGGRGGGPID